MGRRRWGPGNCALGTSNDIFFYVGPFRYPSTACGILLSHSIESDHVDTAKATPFDSGGLVHRLGRPDADESVSTYLARRELPPDHRQYLSYTLTALFHSPEDYLEGTDPLHPSPLGLTGGDARAWTHEVRLPGRVMLWGNRHLQALFLKATVANDPNVEAMLTWCQRDGIDLIYLPSELPNELPNERDGGFTVLQRRCRRYLREKLNS